MPNKNKQYYRISLPTSGIPAKYMRLMEEMRKEHGTIFVNFYQSAKVFYVYGGKTRAGNYRPSKPTNFWIEISSDSLQVRKDPKWVG